MVSVIIPTYNNAEYIEAAIKSIQDQSYKDLEIIVIDDCSTDNTAQIIQKIMLDDYRVSYYLNNRNTGKKFNRKGVNIDAGYSARNLGIDAACGEWITFQDSDDISLLNRIEIQLQLAEQHKVSHLSTSCVWLKEEYFGKSLAYNRYVDEIDPENRSIGSIELYNMARSGLGILSKLLPDFLFRLIPFRMKNNRFLVSMFFAHEKPYPGSGQSIFLKSELVKKDSILFRALDSRRWPSMRGRGTDRDFNYHCAMKFKDSLHIDIPLYCWRTPKEFQAGYKLENYIDEV